ncbi:MAG: hypothetical protein AAF412_09625 [Pseudomonadota bacterium]
MDETTQQTERERNAEALQDQGLLWAQVGGIFGLIYNVGVGYMMFAIRCHYNDVCFADPYLLPFVTTTVAAATILYFARKARKRNSRRISTIVLIAAGTSLVAWFPYYTWGFFFVPQAVLMVLCVIGGYQLRVAANRLSSVGKTT